MELKLGACGLVCSNCDAFIATANNNQEQLEQVAALWRKIYKNDDIAADNIRCTGCMSDGKEKSGFCLYVCKVKRCATQKQVENCGRCSEFPCFTIDELHGFMGEQGKHQHKLLSEIKEITDRMHSIFK